MPSGNRRVRTGLCALLTGLAAASCTDETIVERLVEVPVEVPREVYAEPAEAALGMLGYSDQESGLTSCGNCHVGVQSTWDDTGHADAWAGLQDSGHAAEFCEGCHTVSELGNTLTEAAGYNATGEDRYHDVQCESCHGPGLDHVLEPADANVPLAPMSVGVANDEGCGECHSGDHHPFTDQWETSGHAVLGFAASRDGCNSCHSGNGALAAWGVSSDYLETDPFAITCAVCHDPHGSDNPADLRFPLGGPGVEIEDNLCAQCHSRRVVPDAGSSHGLHPHSPHTAMLNGEAGFVFPGMVIDVGEIVSSHGLEGNTNQCATCHVASTEITDAVTGEFVLNAVGHGFNAIPCVDAQGVPTAGDCGLEATDRDYETGCVASGCHSSAANIQGLTAVVANRLRDLTEEVEELLAIIDPNGEEAGGEIDARDGVLTAAEGALFNVGLAHFGKPGDGEPARPDTLLWYTAAAAHNPFLTEELLRASIRALENEYGAILPLRERPAGFLDRQIKADGVAQF